MKILQIKLIITFSAIILLISPIQSDAQLFIEQYDLQDIIRPDKNLKINEVMASNLSVIRDNYGEYDDWFELYNISDDTVNLKGLYISDSRKNLSRFRIACDTLLPPGGYIILWADDNCDQGFLHTSFKLDANGERLYICNEDLVILDSVKYPGQIANTSYGRLNNDILNWNYFINPTPGFANPDAGLLTLIEPPWGEPLSGFYSEPFCLKLSHPDKDVVIRYTVNGDIPDETSQVYTDCISIDTTTIVRYRAFKNSCVPGMTQTRTFFYDNPDLDLDIISISMNNTDLYGPSGIFTRKNTELEKPAHIEFMGSDGKMKFNIDGGLRVHSPKINPQLSLSIYARSDYGFEDINYPIFKNKDIFSFNRLILRNGGNDGSVSDEGVFTHFRDGLHHILFEKTGNKQAASAYLPVNVFINGNYYGIYNIREKIDRKFIESNFDYDGNMDLLERTFGYSSNRKVHEGSFALYDSVLSFFRNHDMTIPEDYETAAALVDVDRFIDYWIHEVYIGNFDWMCNNIYIYYPYHYNGKFRWILWDTDHGSGLPYKSYGKPEWMTLQWSLSTDQTRTTGGVDNLITRCFLKNDGFRFQFINRYADLLNSVYKYDHIAFVIDSIKDLLHNDMKFHCDRWGISYSKWEQAIAVMKKYHELRTGYVRKDIMNCFGLGKLFNVTLKTNDHNAGIIRINTITPSYNDNTWQGIYFSDVPVTIEAIPNKDYKFKGWKNSALSGNPRQTVYLTSDNLFEAVFVYSPVDSSRIIINEISLGNSPEPNSLEWIEIVNKTGKERWLANWKLETGTGEYVFDDIKLKNNEFLLVTKSGFSMESNGAEVVTFKDFSVPETGGTIKLIDNEGRVLDQVTYSIFNSELIQSGRGFTFELKDPYSDNSISVNWRSSLFPGGTPGKPNMNSDDFRNISINEFMAMNKDLIYDEYLEADDWIELYNRGQEEIDIRGLFITDNRDNPFRYQIPDFSEAITIRPGNFKILWADGQPEQGPLHLNFKLEGIGEEIAIFQNNGYELVEIDRIRYDCQYNWYSYGREYDGVGNQRLSWKIQNPTPGGRNGFPYSGYTGVNEETINEEDGFRVYPVPAGNDLYIERSGNNTSRLHIEIYNIYGIRQQISQPGNDYPVIHIRLDDLVPGVYLLRIVDDEGRSYTRKIVK